MLQRQNKEQDLAYCNTSASVQPQSQQTLLGSQSGHQTALHRAAVVGNHDAISALIHGGCALDLQDKEGNTALHEVSWHGFSSCVKLLVKAGANVQVKNKVQRFARGRTVRKRRDVLRAQRRTQSLPRVHSSREKDYTEVAEDINNSDQVHQPERKTATLSPGTRRKIRSPRRQLEHVFRREYQLHERGSPSQKIIHSSPSSQEKEEAPGKAYQLYTLYRDKDGQIKQAPVNDCRCKPLIKTLENKLKAAKMEMRSEIHTVQEEINCRLGRIEQKNKHQIKVLEELTQERVSAERMECHYRINQRATLECMEGERKQVAATNAVKSWCMSKIQDLEVRMPAETQKYKLLRSPSVDQSLVDSDPEGLPLLSLISEESSSSLATYVNVLPSPGAGPNNGGKSLEFRDSRGRRYFEMKLNGSSGEYHNLTAPSIVKHKPLSRKLATADPKWHRAEVQEVNVSKSWSDKGDELCDSSGSSSLSTSSKRFNHSNTEPANGPAWKHSRHLKDRIKAYHAQTQQSNTMKTREVFSQRPVEATFTQERPNLHAMEVTQRFFETVSAQLERWYERKIQEVQKVAEQEALQDRASLLERINILEEELQKLRTNTNTNS
ncbi:hypothetical protein cypCar_00007065 [Cyprinus carpio]|nr:hypothetical protein cypCar_00007065 [Cyprinus carpio]